MVLPQYFVYVDSTGIETHVMNFGKILLNVIIKINVSFIKNDE